MTHFTLTLLAWSARHFANEKTEAVNFRDAGNIEAARRFAGYARESYATVQKILNSSKP